MLPIISIRSPVAQRPDRRNPKAHRDRSQGRPRLQKRKNPDQVTLPHGRWFVFKNIKICYFKKTLWAFICICIYVHKYNYKYVYMFHLFSTPKQKLPLFPVPSWLSKWSKSAAKDLSRCSLEMFSFTASICCFRCTLEMGARSLAARSLVLTSGEKWSLNVMVYHAITSLPDPWYQSPTYGDSGIGTNFVMSHLSPRNRSKCSTNSFRYTVILFMWLVPRQVSAASNLPV